MGIERVLVVDDEPDIREVIDMTLRELAGWDVLTASTGWEGLARAHEHTPDVILLDVMMPDMNGLEAMAALAALPGTEDIPVIVMTAKSRYAGDNVIVKPFDPTTLATRIGEIVDHLKTMPRQPSTVALAERMQELWLRHRTRTLARVDEMIDALAQLADCAGRPAEALAPLHATAGSCAHALIGTAGMFRLPGCAARCQRIQSAVEAYCEGEEAAALLPMAREVRIDFERDSMVAHWNAAEC